ncbi:flagellar export chaperone FliS [Planococcus sp. X10-3]|uniref:flagellar export chaperone FliS n=1 Tax=Planococcus sp. X10-3 TaxID=3061240 RepID=UPI003BAE936E
MAINNPYQTYQQNSVVTASPQELTLMLYNGCLKFIKLAKRAMEEGKFEEKNVNLIKAQNIIQEFLITLDPTIEISEGLAQLYEYIHHRLMEANMKNDVVILEDAENQVKELRDTWKEAMVLVKVK